MKAQQFAASALAEALHQPPAFPFLHLYQPCTISAWQY